jgi:hypothetical protein
MVDGETQHRPVLLLLCPAVAAIGMCPSDAVWTFSRNDELLQLHRVRTEEGLFVVERQDGFRDRSFLFPDIARLIQFENERIRCLHDTGWTLVDFWPERRSGVERRRHKDDNGRRGVFHARSSQRDR